jgi:hypothetical protein
MAVSKASTEVYVWGTTLLACYSVTVLQCICISVVVSQLTCLYRIFPCLAGESSKSFLSCTCLQTDQQISASSRLADEGQDEEGSTADDK